MQVLQVGSSGVEVQKWEWFLTGQGFSPGKDDGLFDAATKLATIAFQRKWGLSPDGGVGRETLGKAVALGFGEVNGGLAEWPPKPAFEHLSDDARGQIFGQFEYTPSPTPGNPEGITLHGDWEAKNIVTVQIPQLANVRNAPHNGVVRLHHLVAQQYVNFFKAMEDAGLIHLIISWGGSYFPRFIRGSTTRLSNHSYGTAMDLNADWNPLGAEPALIGTQGCMREPASHCTDFGLFWGGWFTRLDGMHLEAFKVA
jgi:peptidoglycan hydrolase-like protein with peptidoglycan-binding domain